MSDAPKSECATSPTKCVDPVRPFRVRRMAICLAGAIVFLPTLWLGANFAWQNWLGPKVDPSLGNTVDIRRGADPEANTPKLPGLLESLTAESLADAENPLDVVLDLAEKALEQFRRDVTDYECVMFSEVCINGKIREPQYMACKIRPDRIRDGKTIPFAVYGKFLKPQRLLGQEVIWIEDQNDGNLIAHLPGLLNLKRFYLPPDGSIAMNGNKYPITEIGLENLLKLMIDRGKRDREYGPCAIMLDTKVDVTGRPCVLLEIEHPKKEGPYDFHLARIYIDIEHQFILGYESFDWPKSSGEEPPLIERFFYSDVKLNVGLSDRDFDPDNPDYNFPRN